MRSMLKGLGASAVALGVLAVVAATATDTVAQIRAALVRDADSPIRGERFLQTFTGNFADGAFTETEQVTLNIPAGKKLFIQSVDMHVLLTNNQGLMEASFRILNSAVYRYWLDMNFQAAGATQGHFVGKAEVNTTVVPGDSFSVFAFRNDNLGSSSLNFFNGTITGYLVDQNP